MPISKNYQVVVIGGGITGLSVLYHLRQLGFHEALLIDDGKQPAYQSLPSSLMLSGWVDNVTRMSHARSLAVVKDLYQFSSNAFTYTKDTLATLKIAVHSLPFFRLFLTAHEQDEGRAAVDDFTKIGARAEVIGEGHYNWSAPYQRSDESAATLSATAAIDALREHVEERIKRQRCVSIDRKQDGYLIHLSSGETLNADFVVLACHLQIPGLLGSLRDAFVATTEQWHLFQVDETKQLPPYLASANYSHEFYAHLGKGIYLAGGARFLRKNAGVDEVNPQVSPKITEHLIKRMTSLFSWQRSPEIVGTAVGQECRPCDELPVIGSMFGDRGILLASGYMGQGLSFGFYAGLILAELLMYGKTTKLPSALTPERFRSLKE